MGKVRFTKKEFDGMMSLLAMMDFDMTVRTREDTTGYVITITEAKP